MHYAAKGQELNWHFDNSKFAITLLLQAPKGGGHFEYVSNLRNAEKNEMNFEGVEAVLNGKTKINRLDTRPGTLILFRGQNSIHSCLLYTSPSPRDRQKSRMPSSA